MKKTEIKLTCNDCIFFNSLIHPANNLTCQKEGILSYSEPCNNFCVNCKNIPFIYTDDKGDYQFIRNTPTYKLNKLAALIVQEGYNRSNGFSMGDIIYYCLGKSDYISSYVQAIFKGMVGNTDFAIIESLNENGKPWVGIVETKFLIKGSQWETKHRELVEKERISDESLKNIYPNFEYCSDEEFKKEGYKPQNIINIINKGN